MNFEVGELRARVAARACSWGRARMRGARVLRSPLETCAAEAGQVGQPRGVERAVAGRERGSQSCAPILPLPQGLELSPILFFNLPPPCSRQLSGTGL